MDYGVEEKLMHFFVKGGDTCMSFTDKWDSAGTRVSEGRLDPEASIGFKESKAVSYER